jgi:hypothetical protein
MSLEEAELEFQADGNDTWYNIIVVKEDNGKHKRLN